MCLGFMAQAIQSTPTEEQKVEHLITYVANLKDAVFIRNGSEHTPLEAADHLRMKWKKAGTRIKTVDDFIINIATKSSMTGNPYLIRLRDGKEYPSDLILRIELKKFMQQKH